MYNTIIRKLLLYSLFKKPLSSDSMCSVHQITEKHNSFTIKNPVQKSNLHGIFSHFFDLTFHLRSDIIITERNKPIQNITEGSL